MIQNINQIKLYMDFFSIKWKQPVNKCIGQYHYDIDDLSVKCEVPRLILTVHVQKMKYVLFQNLGNLLVPNCFSVSRQ